MFERIVAYGDSWTYGSCTDLIKIDPTILAHDEIDYGVTGERFVNSWPEILAKKLNKKIKNYALAGLPNKGIVSNLYDSVIFNCINSKEDLIIVLLSTWHRDFEWTNSEKRYSNHYFSRSPSNLESKHIILDSDLKPNIITNEKIKLAYQTFCDFFSIVNLLENLKFKYYIGYAFSTINELSLYIDPLYVAEMKKNTNLLDPFIKYAPSVFYQDTLLHPNQKEHKIYADYLADKITRDFSLEVKDV